MVVGRFEDDPKVSPEKWSDVHFGLIKLLVKKGVDVNATDINGLTALHYLANEFVQGNDYTPDAGKHYLRVARYLLKKGANANKKSKVIFTLTKRLRFTPLTYMMREGLPGPISQKYRKQHLKDIKKMEMLLLRYMK